jgi:pre-mRNA-processing factor SLU7
MEDESSNANPYMPSFISQAPWYLKQDQPGLVHQKSQKVQQKSDISSWYQKGSRVGAPITKYRKGACTNCGSMTHDVKTCCERPRKVGARYTGKNLMRDEALQQLNLSWEAKRDRWNGYQPEMYNEVLEEWGAIDNERKKRKVEELEETIYKGIKPESALFEDEEKNQEYAYNELVNNIDPRTKTTTRNYRQREDTAAYLHNLDTNELQYDGKSRAAREIISAVPESTDDNQMYRDSWVKITGDMISLNEQEEILQKINSQGNDLNSMSNPSQSEALYKYLKDREQEVLEKREEQLESVYGQQNFVKPVEIPKESEEYKEYTRQGEVYKKAEKTPKYSEDVFVNGHTSVWGSWYDRETGLWGYACCRIVKRLDRCKGNNK